MLSGRRSSAATRPCRRRRYSSTLADRGAPKGDGDDDPLAPDPPPPSPSSPAARRGGRGPVPPSPVEPSADGAPAFAVPCCFRLSLRAFGSCDKENEWCALGYQLGCSVVGV